MAPRSRTGCLTCRQRKLKCSEERPVCAQCLKANRECIPSSGITFRHQQNPSMNGDPIARESLKSFYGYKETFTDQTIWVAVPKDLTFIHTNNPYEDEDGIMSDDVDVTTNLSQDGKDDIVARQAELSLSQALYPAYATHGLEALSAVASQDHQYNYAPIPPSHQPSRTSPPVPSATLTQQLLKRPESHQTLKHELGSDAQRDTLDYILNAPQPEQASSHIGGNGMGHNYENINRSQNENNIDPRLHSPITASSVQHAFAQGHSPQHRQHRAAVTPQHVRTQSYSSTLKPMSSLHQGNRKFPPIHDRELAFFLRDFSERAGHWMDIFDLDCFFGAHVPILAVKSPLLVYACAALSAKSLGRVDGRKPTMNGQTSRAGRSKLEYWPGLAMTTDDWVRKGRESYDVAISLLRQSLDEAARPRTASLPAGLSPQAALSTPGTAVTPSAAQTGRSSPASFSDELLAATAILCVYEFLDASGLEWSRHLDGAKILFDVAKDSMVPQAFPPSPMSIARQASQYLGDGLDLTDHSAASNRPSQGRVAVFWNFARQDMLAAFIHSTRTRLDANDLPMWQNAGLSLSFDGKIRPSNPQHPEYDQDFAMRDDMICNALIWLMSKLVNFISHSEDASDPASSLALDARQQNLVDEWNDLNEQLQVWYDGLPDSFHPSVVREPEGGFGIDETWFPRAMCGSTMQSYHFAKIQLLHHKPLNVSSTALRRQGSTLAGLSVAARHAEYSNILQQTRTHAKEIVSIALGRADEGARVHAVQPLWTAGLVLGGSVNNNDDGHASAEAETWRCTIVSLLRAIERDMGWAAEYRVQSLLELWNLPLDWDPESDFALG